MLPQDFVIAIPRQPSPARAATQPFLPYPTDAPIELLKTAVVRRSSVVLVVAAELGVQGFPLLVHRLVPVLLAPGGDRLQSPAEPFADRLHVHGELPLPAAGAHVGESRPGGFHLEPLAEPDVNLSAHPAPIKQTLRSYRYPSVRRETCVPWQAVVETGSPGPYGL